MIKLTGSPELGPYGEAYEVNVDKPLVTVDALLRTNQIIGELEIPDSFMPDADERMRRVRRFSLSVTRLWLKLGLPIGQGVVKGALLTNQRVDQHRPPAVDWVTDQIKRFMEEDKTFLDWQDSIADEFSGTVYGLYAVQLTHRGILQLIEDRDALFLSDVLIKSIVRFGDDGGTYALFADHFPTDSEEAILAYERTNPFVRMGFMQALMLANITRNRLKLVKGDEKPAIM